MNDRLKYRVWFNKSKRYAVNKDDIVLFPDGDVGQFDIIGCYDEKDVTVEQCTGLKDKNGKLIYEGDILGGIWGGYIAWCEEEKSFEMFSPIYGCMSCDGDVMWQEIVEDNELEVIGNVHEDKDLLGVETR